MCEPITWNVLTFPRRVILTLMAWQYKTNLTREVLLTELCSDHVFPYVDRDRVQSLTWLSCGLSSIPDIMALNEPHPVLVAACCGIVWSHAMMTSSNGNIFRVAGLLCGELFEGINNLRNNVGSYIKDYADKLKSLWNASPSYRNERSIIP